ncbi:hypothetical protein LSAT2_008803 [Lamellibrachia satsuma]|nr:hypothetical protein LSAT2_008803 [Lamellibrachia satsuma]
MPWSTNAFSLKGPMKGPNEQQSFFRMGSCFRYRLVSLLLQVGLVSLLLQVGLVSLLLQQKASQHYSWRPTIERSEREDGLGCCIQGIHPTASVVVKPAVAMAAVVDSPMSSSPMSLNVTTNGAVSALDTEQDWLCLKDESELVQVKLKGLDETGPVAMTTKPYKDVNTFINNQLTFVSAQGVIPPDQMKCNILKAQAEEQYKNTGLSADKTLTVEMPPKEDTPRVWNARERTYSLSSPTTPGHDDVFPS